MFWNWREVTIAQHCESTECHWIVQFKMVDFIFCEFYLKTKLHKPRLMKLTSDKIQWRVSCKISEQSSSKLFLWLNTRQEKLSQPWGVKGHVTANEMWFSGWDPGGRRGAVSRGRQVKMKEIWVNYKIYFLIMFQHWLINCKKCTIWM